MGENTISHRASELPKYTAEYLWYIWNKPPSEFYKKETNPDGLAVLTIAENVLTIDMLTNKMKHVPPLTKEVCMYGTGTGLKASIAKLFSKTFFKGRTVDPSHIALSNGAGPTVNMVAYALCNPGEGIITTTPYYPGFDMDLGFASIKVIPAHLSSEDNFKFNIAAVQQAYEKATSENIIVRGLLVASPNNPMGQVYQREELLTMWKWANENKIHLIMDEIYALSCFDENHPFISISDLLLEEGQEFGNYVHVVWSFSKDFDMSGLRVGALYSENKDLLAAMGNQSYFYFSSNLAQHYINYLLEDEEFTHNFIATNQRNLRTNYEALTGVLDRHQIPYIPGNAGFFILLDLRKYLEAPTEEAQMKFWKKLVEECKVVFTPSSAMHTEPGWYRCCYAAYDSKSIEVIMERFANFVKALSK